MSVPNKPQLIEMVRIYHKTLARFLVVCQLAIDNKRIPTEEEVMHALDCSYSCAYKYLAAFRVLLQIMPL